jgi:hypothetical protein
MLIIGERIRTLTSFTTLNALVYPAYAKLTFTRAFDKPYRCLLCQKRVFEIGVRILDSCVSAKDDETGDADTEG